MYYAYKFLVYWVYINFQCPIKKGGKIMSKHHHQDDCCYPDPCEYGAYGAYGVQGADTCGGGVGFSKWIYALLILIVIVLQFGRRKHEPTLIGTGACGEGATTVWSGNNTVGDRQEIDNSILFIIIVFLLILCAGCFGGNGVGGGVAGYGVGGYGY